MPLLSSLVINDLCQVIKCDKLADNLNIFYPLKQIHSIQSWCGRLYIIIILSHVDIAKVALWIY